MAPTPASASPSVCRRAGLARSTAASILAAAALALPATADEATSGVLPPEVLLVCDSAADVVRAFDPATGADLGVIVPDPGSVDGFDVFRRPLHAIDSGAGTLLVSDQFGDAVLEFDWSGTYLGIFSNEGVIDTDLIDNVRGIALAADGSLLVSNAGSGIDETLDSLVTFDGAGAAIPSLVFQKEGGVRGPFDVLRVDAGPLAGLLVSNEGADTIVRFDADGRFVERFADDLDFPQQLALAQNGNVLVANFSAGTIREYAPDGTLAAELAPGGLSGFRGVAELDDGRLLVTSSSGVHVVSRTGVLEATVATGTEFRYVERVLAGGAPPLPAGGGDVATRPVRRPATAPRTPSADPATSPAPSASTPTSPAGAPVAVDILVIEDSGFFGVPGLTTGTVGRLDPAAPGTVEIVGTLEDAVGGLNAAGLDVAASGVRYAFDTSTNSVRALGPAGTPIAPGLLDSVGVCDDAVGGLALSLDGTELVAVGNESFRGIVIRADATTGATIEKLEFFNRSFSAAAIVPDVPGLPHPAGTLLAVQNLGSSARLVAIDLDAGTITDGPSITGLGFFQAFEAGLDFAPDGTLYAMLQGFDGPDVPARLYVLDPATGGTTLLGTIGGGGWDASSIAVVPRPADAPGDVDGDGDVDFEDVLALLAAWGPCPAPPAACPADLDGSGTVDFGDLLVVLANFDV